MTNKTITLDRELVSRIVGLRPDYTCAQLDADEELVRAALADPVPPAGGDVEVLAYLTHPLKGSTLFYLPSKNIETADGDIPLVDRAHVTRLQAEVDHWKRLWGKAISAGADLEEERDALQAKLTKARELLSTHCPNISIGVREFLSNQSAPADKGGDS